MTARRKNRRARATAGLVTGALAVPQPRALLSGLSPEAREVGRAYRQDALARVCTMPEQDFGRAFGMETVKIPELEGSYRWTRQPGNMPEDYYHFRDNGSRVLAVAHLDTVTNAKGRVPLLADTQDGPFIRSGALDDRLGAYVILHLLPAAGITCDWLLTVGEESCSSTAEHFTPPKDYDHVIEFDRMGTDVVMYQYEDAATQELVEAAGAEPGLGSFSDIAVLEQLGVKCFNWGVGYRGNYHSANGYAFLNDTFAMAARYLRFHEQNAGTRLLHNPYSRYGRLGLTDDEAYIARCWFCSEFVIDPDTGYCRACTACDDCGEFKDDCLCYVSKSLARKAAVPDDERADDAEAGDDDAIAVVNRYLAG